MPELAPRRQRRQQALTPRRRLRRIPSPSSDASPVSSAPSPINRRSKQDVTSVGLALTGTFILRCASYAAGLLILVSLGIKSRSESDVTAGVASLVAVTFYASELIGAPIFGALSDRFGRKPFMILGPIFGGIAAQLMSVHDGHPGAGAGARPGGPVDGHRRARHAGLPVGADGRLRKIPRSGHGLLRGRHRRRPGARRGGRRQTARSIRPDVVHDRRRDLLAGAAAVPVRPRSSIGAAREVEPPQPAVADAEPTHHALRAGLAGGECGAGRVVQRRAVSGSRRAERQPVSDARLQLQAKSAWSTWSSASCLPRAPSPGAS